MVELGASFQGALTFLKAYQGAIPSAKVKSDLFDLMKSDYRANALGIAISKIIEACSKELFFANEDKNFVSAISSMSFAMSTHLVILSLKAAVGT